MRNENKRKEEKNESWHGVGLGDRVDVKKSAKKVGASILPGKLNYLSTEEEVIKAGL